jgi:putative hydrolase of the HAD superfamily
LPTGALRGVAFAQDFLMPAISGAISDEEWREQVATELERQYPRSLARIAVEQWSVSPVQLDLAVLAVLSRCCLDLRLILATNATSRLSRDLHRLGLANRFYVVANSSELGVAKPSAAYFEGALHRANAQACEALFVDDSIANVRAALAAGIVAHHFTGHEALSSFLREAGVLTENADPSIETTSDG